MAVLNERLKELRTGKNMTQQQVADFLNMKVFSVQRYEYGEHRPSLDTLIALADYYDVSLDYIVGRSDNPKRL